MKNFYKNKRILVAGASGFVGTNLIKKLLSLKANVTGVIHKQKLQVRFDKVKYLGKEYFIKGKMTTGYSQLMDIDNNFIKLKPIPKFSNMIRLTARKTWLIV